MPRCFPVSVLLFMLFVSYACQTTRHTWYSVASGQANRFFQFSVIPALQRGVFDDRAFSCGQLRRKGNFGLGTFNALDGEMLLLNDTVFQAKSDGSVHIVDDSVRSPFAVACYFIADTVVILRAENQQDFYQQLTQILSPNYIYALRSTGTFDTMVVRSVSRQDLPYTTLTEATARQAVFSFNQPSGLLIGFFSPQYLTGLNVPGFHSHFMSDNRAHAGHLLRFSGARLRVEIARMRSVEIEFPSGGRFPSVNLFDIDPNDIHKAEK